MNRLGSVVFAVVLFAAHSKGILAIRWTSSQTIPDGSHVTGCRGHDLELPWSFTVDQNAALVNTEWYYVHANGTEDLLATQAHGTFYPPPDASVRVQQAPGAGNGAILIPAVTPRHNGKYSVHVNVYHTGTIPSSDRQTVTVLVADPPAVSSAGFQARIDNISQSAGVLHVRLACGTFTHLGNPPLVLQWRTPTNAMINSTDYANGVFYLDIDSTQPDGDYSCFVQKHLPPLQCVDSSSPLRGNATVSVSNSHLRLLTLETKLQTLTAQYSQLAQQNGLLGPKLALLESSNARLTQQLQELQHNQTALQSLNQQLRQQVQNLTDEVTALKADNADLHRQDVKLTEQVSNVSDTLRHHLLAMQDFVELPQNCRDVARYAPDSGQHTLFTRGRTYHAFCDQATQGGGWTVIQRREDGSEEFYRGWKDYENGFGHVTGEHWIGLEKLFLLTSSNDYELRVELEAFDGSTAWAQYSNFTVDSAAHSYTLHVSGYTGTAGDSLRLNDQEAFSTFDNDNDLSNDNCAHLSRGAFWYGDCTSVNVNGEYKPAAAASDDAVFWYDWKGTSVSLKRVVMKVKPL